MKTIDFVLGCLVFSGASYAIGAIAPSLDGWDRLWVMLVVIIACGVNRMIGIVLSGSDGHGKKPSRDKVVY